MTTLAPDTVSNIVAPDISAQQEALADEAFETYRFGKGLKVEQREGWDTESYDGQDDWTRVVRMSRAGDKPNADLHDVSFHVKFIAGTTRIDEAYAYWCKTGADIGSPGIALDSVAHV